jgi:RNA polymerase sigma factor (TIGR02999 family)
MRHFLVDYARARDASRRSVQKVPLDGPVEAVIGSESDCETVLAVDEALRQLAAVDARQARVVELRFFGGLTIDEAAEVLGCSGRAVNRDWRMAQAWLSRALSARPT